MCEQIAEMEWRASGNQLGRAVPDRGNLPELSLLEIQTGTSQYSCPFRPAGAAPNKYLQKQPLICILAFNLRRHSIRALRKRATAVQIVSRLVLALSGLSLLAAIGSALLIVAPSPAPALAITPQVYEGGAVRQGDIVTSVFELKNNSQSTIHVDELRASCSCTASRISSRDLRPGESTEVQIETNTGTARGPIETRVVLTYQAEHEPQAKQSELVMRCSVDPDFDYEPAALTFSRKDSSEATMRLRGSKWLPEFEVTEVFANRQWLSVSEVVKAPDGSTEFTVSLAKKEENAEFDGDGASIAIKSNSARQSTLWVPVKIVD